LVLFHTNFILLNSDTEKLPNVLSLEGSKISDNKKTVVKSNLTVRCGMKKMD